MPAKRIMFQGTSSHAGKSILTAAFCRLLKRRGIRVAPFKAMNMSNNAWVAQGGGEMAVAQAAQAKACGVTPTVQMNPVLLKTLSDSICQIIQLGKPLATVAAAEYHTWRDRLLESVERAFGELQESYEFIVMEGAGSPAEINLRKSDIANMEVALRFNAPVILVADIERGGVFAQIVGTLELLTLEERARVKGFIINKFRGDPKLLESGIRWLEERTGLPVFGVLSYLEQMRIPEEDALAERLQQPAAAQEASGADSNGSVRIQVLRYPTIANFTDLDPLHHEPGVRVEYLSGLPRDTAWPHLLILPGSRSTIADLNWLRRSGLDQYIRHCLEQGTQVLGICGGFQMLGERLDDPSHVESQETSAQGLGLLPTSTLFLPTKITAQVSGTHLETQTPVKGYEIHYGRSQKARRGKPVIRLNRRGGQPVDELDGCQLEDKPIWGTYLHGLFDEKPFREAFLANVRQRHFGHPADPLPCSNSPRPSLEQGQVERSAELRAATGQTGRPEHGGEPVGLVTGDPYDALADAVEQQIQVGRILDLADNP